MKYFKLSLSTDKQVIGCYPQSVEMIKVGDFAREENIQLGYDGPIKKLAVLPETKLQHKARITHIIDSSYLRHQYFLIIHPQIVHFFEQFQIPEFEIFDTPVHHKNKVYDYKLFHIEYPSNDEFIRFEKSEFYIGERGKGVSSLMINIGSYDEYKDIRKQVKIDYPGKNLLCKRLLLDLSNIHFDLFRLTLPPALGYFISERMKDKIEELGYTGFAFKEIDEMDHDRVAAVY